MELWALSGVSTALFNGEQQEPRRLAVATPLSRTGNRRNDMQVILELSSEGLSALMRDLAREIASGYAVRRSDQLDLLREIPYGA